MTLGTVAVAGGKGGCGKTTTTLGLGRALRSAGHDPLAVDADTTMPDLAVTAGIAPTASPRVGSSPGARDDAGALGHRDDHRMDWERDEAGLRVVRPTAATATGTGAIERTLRACTTSAATTLVDCPAGAGRDAVTPLRLADRVVVVTLPTKRSVDDACKTAAMARAVGTPVAGVVVTRSTDPDARLSTVIDAPVLAGVPPLDDPLRTAAGRRAFVRVAAALGAETGHNQLRAKS